MQVEYKAAGTVKEALDLVKDKCPDIILADILLGDGDVTPVIKYCQDKFPKCRSILMSAMQASKAAEVAKNLRVSELLHKPFDLDALEKVLRRTNN